MCFNRDDLRNSNLRRGKTANEMISHGDFHAWVEDQFGRVVFDPDFPEHQLINQKHHTTQEKFYHAWRGGDQPEQKDAFDIVLKNTIGDLVSLAKVFGAQSYFEPMFGRCNFNSYQFLKHNKDKGYKMVIGSMGWVRKDTSIWFEWG